jgi:hypothetical protein
VLIGFQPAARVTDKLVCGPTVDVIAGGSPTVIIGNQQAARMGDPTSHGGVIVGGWPTVLIGIPGQGAALAAASRDGAPFCEACEKKRRKEEEERRRQEQEAEESGEPEEEGAG